MKDNIILIGGGGHCKACIDVIELEAKYTIAGIVDVKEKLRQSVLGYNIFATDKDLSDLVKKNQYFFITLGHIKSPEKRIKLFESVRHLGAKLPVVISPLAYVSKHAEIGEGKINFLQVIEVTPPRPRTKKTFVPDASLSPEERFQFLISGGTPKKNSDIVEGETVKVAKEVAEFLKREGFLTPE